MYSAHDSTVLPALESLGLDTTEWPPFAADLILELYEDNEKNHFIRVRYIGKVSYFIHWKYLKCKLSIKFKQEITVRILSYV